jgi:predicted ATPase
MRINKVSIENFKCFKAVDIQLGKLTLLTGANSSGKSSILYSILGALQSGEFPFQFSPNGKYVNMGNFREMSYKHLKENIIKIGIRIEFDKDVELELNTWWEEDRVRKLPRLNKLAVDDVLYKLEITKNRKYTFNHRLCSREEVEKSNKLMDWNRYDDYHKSQLLAREDSIFPRTRHKDSTESINFTFDKFDQIEEIIRSKEQDAYLAADFEGAKHTFPLLDKRINFISSFRLFPERTYYETTKTDLRVGKFGEDYVNQVILWESQKAKEYERLIEIMKSLSLLEDISSNRLDGGRFELVVKVNKNSVPASLNDVGFGISQFLPIVVADLQLGGESTLFVAQPEIHLHPSVQAEFGNYMVHQIKESKKNYIIETHSEYLLNRIRLAIVKGEIPKDEVKIYYLQNDGEDVHTHQLEFTTDGQILNAPEDFFKTYQMDVMNIAMSANGE